MEDWNTLVADCVVISCCCQCLILQIVIFIFLRLPCKLIQKTKEYAKKKLIKNRTKEGKIIETVKVRRRQHEFWKFHGDSESVQLEEFSMNGDFGFGCCIEEVERVLEEFSEKGEFAFGSFWGRERPGRLSSTNLDQKKFDHSVVQFEVVETVASLSY